MRGFHVCEDPRSLRDLACQLASCLRCGDFVGLDGPLGVGKTEFVKGMAEEFACRTVPTSPTFSVAHEYEGRNLTLYHFDFYRIDDSRELETSGFWECLAAGVTVAEWAGKFENFLPPGSVRVLISFREESGRRVEIR